MTKCLQGLIWSNKMKKIFIPLRLLFLVSLFSTPMWAQFSVGGSFDNTSTLSAGKDDPTDFMNSSELNIDLGYKGNDWRFYSEMSVGLHYGIGDMISAFPNNYIYTRDLSGNSEMGIALDIDRMFIKINSIMGTWTIGRSYLSFGQPYLFNSLEWYKKFSPTDPTATKEGINLISLDVPIGAYGKAEFFIGGTDAWDTPIAGTEIVLGTNNFEMGLSYQYKGYNSNVVGAFFKADIVIALFGSYAVHLNDVTTEQDFSHSHEFSLGIDYSFPIGMTTLLVQQIFYYNSLGATTESELMTMPFGDYYFRGGAYSYTSLMLAIDQFSSLGLNMIINMYDASGMILPQGSFNLLDGLSLEIITGFTWGKDNTEFSPTQQGVPNFILVATLTADF